MPGSGVTLPLNLTQIASRCTGSFYAPRRFAAVQLACECRPFAILDVVVFNLLLTVFDIVQTTTPGAAC